MPTGQTRVRLPLKRLLGGEEQRCPIKGYTAYEFPTHDVKCCKYLHTSSESIDVGRVVLLQVYHLHRVACDRDFVVPCKKRSTNFL